MKKLILLLFVLISIHCFSQNYEAGSELIKASRCVFAGTSICVVGGLITYAGINSYNNEYADIMSKKYIDPVEIKNRDTEIYNLQIVRNTYVAVGTIVGLIGVVLEFKAWYHISKAGEKLQDASSLSIHANPSGVSLVYNF